MLKFIVNGIELQYDLDKNEVLYIRCNQRFMAAVLRREAGQWETADNTRLRSVMLDGLEEPANDTESKVKELLESGVFNAGFTIRDNNELVAIVGNNEHSIMITESGREYCDDQVYANNKITYSWELEFQDAEEEDIW